MVVSLRKLQHKYANEKCHIKWTFRNKLTFNVLKGAKDEERTKANNKV
jgi:hypothetical protein